MNNTCPPYLEAGTYFTEARTWISNYILSFLWDVITHPCHNLMCFSSTTIEVAAWMSNYNPQKTIAVITYPCLYIRWTVSLQVVPDDINSACPPTENETWLQISRGIFLQWFLLIIQMQRKLPQLCFQLCFLAVGSLQIFAYATTAQLLCHVQTFEAIISFKSLCEK